MSGKPIILSSEMVRSLLEGRKTQTRRVMKDQPPKNEDFRGSYFGVCRSVADGFRYYSCNQYNRAPKHPNKWELDGSVGVARDAGFPNEYFCPVAVDDLLWVRETLERAKVEAVGYPSDCSWLPNTPWTWKRDTLPAMFMPRWASRLTLRVTNIRAERLQDISEDDARAEGVRGEGARGHALWSGRGEERPTLPSARQAFLDHIWVDLYGEHETKSVGANPWVWVYDFEVIRENIDRVISTNSRQ